MKSSHYIEYKKVLLLSLLLSLNACMGESDSDSDSEGLNEITNVSGQYSIITSAISAECTDGTTDTLAAEAIYGSVEHTGSKIVFINDDQGPLIGATIIESDEMSGVVQPDGRFVMSSSLLATIEGIQGTLFVSYNLSGYFNDTGWRGSYEYAIYFQSYGVTCTYSTPFEGVKD
jgi:hypothetical protein